MSSFVRNVKLPSSACQRRSGLMYSLPSTAQAIGRCRRSTNTPQRPLLQRSGCEHGCVSLPVRAPVAYEQPSHLVPVYSDAGHHRASHGVTPLSEVISEMSFGVTDIDLSACALAMANKTQNSSSSLVLRRPSTGHCFLRVALRPSSKAPGETTALRDNTLLEGR